MENVLVLTTQGVVREIGEEKKRECRKQHLLIRVSQRENPINFFFPKGSQNLRSIPVTGPNNFS